MEVLKNGPVGRITCKALRLKKQKKAERNFKDLLMEISNISLDKMKLKRMSRLISKSEQSFMCI